MGGGGGVGLGLRERPFLKVCVFGGGGFRSGHFAKKRGILDLQYKET